METRCWPRTTDGGVPMPIPKAVASLDTVKTCEIDNYAGYINRRPKIVILATL